MESSITYFLCLQNHTR